MAQVPQFHLSKLPLPLPPISHESIEAFSAGRAQARSLPWRPIATEAPSACHARSRRADRHAERNNRASAPKAGCSAQRAATWESDPSSLWTSPLSGTHVAHWPMYWLEPATSFPCRVPGPRAARQQRTLAPGSGDAPICDPGLSFGSGLIAPNSRLRGSAAVTAPSGRGMRPPPEGISVEQMAVHDGTQRSFLLNASLETLSISRRAVEETLWHLGHQRVEIARIAVDELVGNAINHGHLHPTDDILLDISAGSDRARVEVKQPTIIADARVREPGEAGAGLGLRIVSSLTDRWGFETGPPGVVWFEVGPA